MPRKPTSPPASAPPPAPPPAASPVARAPWGAGGVDKPSPSSPKSATRVDSLRPPRGKRLSLSEELDVYHCGIDLHSKITVYHLLDGDGNTLARGTIDTSEASLGVLARNIQKLTRFYVEASTGSAWCARLIEACGHQAVVVDPNRLRAISSSPKKTDAHDAEMLAMLGKTGLLTPVHVRSEFTDRFRRLLAARHAIVGSRANLIRTTRSLLRSEGHNLPSCDGDDFARRLEGTWGIPEGYDLAVPPLVQAIDGMTTQVLEIEKAVHEVAEADPTPAREAGQDRGRRLRAIPGVGELIATSFLALIEDTTRCASPCTRICGVRTVTCSLWRSCRPPRSCSIGCCSSP